MARTIDGTLSLLPIQSPPVKRGEIVQPHRAVDVNHGSPEALFAVRMALLHGANYNDPAAFDHAAARRFGCGFGCDAGGEDCFE